MWWAIFKYVKIVAISAAVSLLLASNAGAWSLDVSPDFKLSDVKVANGEPCSGNFGTVTVSGEGAVSGCIMGETTRVISYYHAEGGVGYAVGFPFENAFYPVDICQNRSGCVYSANGDTLVGYTGIYQNFVANLTPSIQNGVIHYDPGDQSTILSVSRFGGKLFTPQTFGISENGRWALVELRDYGILRVNVETQEVRRVIAPGFNYGVGNDPRVEVTISNDGNTLAVTGLRVGGIWVVAVDPTCGDKPTESMQEYYTGAETICRYLPLKIDEYISNFIHAFRPRFAKDDKTLSFDVYSNTDSAVHVTLLSYSSPQESYYLALGDSFTSGEGEIDDSFYIGGAANKCHTSTRSYPFLLGTSWHMPASSVACSGATMQTVRGKLSKSNQPSQIAELESHPAQIATIGIGGNDAGLIGKLKDCLGIDTCKWASSSADRHSTAIEIKNLYPHLKQLYVDIKVKTLGAVIVVGYPRIITSQTNCQSVIGVLLNETERIFMNEAIHYLNQVIRAAAIDSGVEYADVENVFSGDELCTSFESSLMNAIRIGDDYPDIPELPFLKIIGAESFHPKPAGHAKIAEKIFETFMYPGAVNTYMNNGIPMEVPTPSDYWDIENSNQKTQLAVPFLSKVTITKKDVFEITFPIFSFKPGSDIVLELHSDVKRLGVVKAASDGSARVSISSTDFEPGFHSVHAVGQNYVGNDIDMYDFLMIKEGVSETGIPGATSASKGGESIHIPRVFAASANEEGTPGVLGASVASVPMLDIPATASLQVKPLTNAPVSGANINYGRLMLLSLIPGLIVFGVSLFTYYRQKQSRNPI